MTSERRNPLRPKRGKRRVRKIIHVLAEGESELDYLDMRSIRQAVRSGGAVVVKRVRHHPGQTDPASLVKRMRSYLKGQDFEKGDEAWIVLDADEWTRDQLEQVISWVQADGRHHVALSNPKFELYLIMHYEDANGCTSAAEVDRRLRRYWKDYRKRIPETKFSDEEIRSAVGRSLGGRAGCDGEIPSPGCTDVGKLVYELLGDEVTLRTDGTHGRE